MTIAILVAAGTFILGFLLARWLLIQQVNRLAEELDALEGDARRLEEMYQQTAAQLKAYEAARRRFSVVDGGKQ